MEQNEKKQVMRVEDLDFKGYGRSYTSPYNALFDEAEQLSQDEALVIDPPMETDTYVNRLRNAAARHKRLSLSIRKLRDGRVALLRRDASVNGSE